MSEEQALDALNNQETIQPENVQSETNEKEVESRTTEEEGFSLEEIAKTLEEEGTEEEGKPKKPVSKVQERIDRLTWEKWEAKRESENLRRELEEIRNVGSSKSSPAQRPIPPLEDDFEDPNEYRKARIKYEDEIFAWNEAQRNIELSKKQAEERFQESLKAFNKRAERMRAKYQDFDDVIATPVFSPTLSQEILDSELGAEIGYYLAKNPDEALRLSSLPPSKVAKEIGKLEIRFSSFTKKTVSTTPPPINPVNGNEVVKRSIEEMPIEDFMKAERQKRIEKRKGRFL